ncbi:hypothetical protein SDC9_191206 [bioreactor metagenome]|uniref:Uncharacterized protein n=1 Tax=bioreactor metagenome TaxID=1076179 RepID=A0A645HYH9_9ZZZZ
MHASKHGSTNDRTHAHVNQVRQDRRHHGSAGGHHAVQPVFYKGHAMHQQTAAHQEHGSSADDGQQAHQPRRAGDQAAAQRTRGAAALGLEPFAHIVHTHDAGHDAVDKHGDRQRHGHQHQKLLQQRLGGDGSQRNRHDFRGKDEIGANGALDLILFVSGGIHRLFLGRAYG